MNNSRRFYERFRSPEFSSFAMKTSNFSSLARRKTRTICNRAAEKGLTRLTANRKVSDIHLRDESLNWH